MRWTPNKVTALRVVVGFVAVALFGHGTWANLAAVVLTVAAIALDALDGYLARSKHMATPLGAQIDILGDRMVENMFFTYFAVVGISARLGVEGRALRVGSERDAASLVGTRAGGFALEPWTLRRPEVRVLLLPGIGAGVDARAGSLAGHRRQ